MPDYSKCVMYKLQCKDPQIKELYVGSTCNFTKRKCDHNSTCNNKNTRNYNLYVYQFIRENGNWENWEMIPFEKYPCKDKMEKIIRERYWSDKLKAQLNSIKPYITKEEKKENKDKYMIEYNKENKELIKIKNKKYYEKNREKEIKKAKIRREKNKEKEKIRRSVYYNCECGSKVQLGKKARHNNTQKHIKFIDTK